MLKVVGASIHKTKLSSGIILGSLLLAVGALFILNIERPHPESIYCATAYWTSSAGYRVEYWGQGHRLEDIPRGAARICYKDSSSDVVEWPHMEVESNPLYGDQVQAFSAGILEGSLLWKSIYKQWMETIVTPCSADEESSKFCDWLRKTVTQNYIAVKSQIEQRLKGHMDSYWYQIHLFYQQLEGIEFGWRYGVKRSPMKRSGLEIPISDFLILNLGSDLKLLEDYYNHVVRKEVPEEEKVRFAMRQPQTIRLSVDGGADFVNLSLDHHLLNGSVMSPFRVLKKYKLNYRLTPATKFSKLNVIVPGHDIVLTSLSGVLASPDEFYAVSSRHSRITIAGVDLRYARKVLLQEEMALEQVVFLSARIMAANRLATSARTWTKVMKRDPHSARQWIVVDRKVLRSCPNSHVTPAAKRNELVADVRSSDSRSREVGSTNENRLAGLVWVVDNVPHRLHGEEVTEMLERKTLTLDGTKPHFMEILGDYVETEVVKEKDQENGVAVDEEESVVDDVNKEIHGDVVRFFAIASPVECSETLTVGDFHNGGQEAAFPTFQSQLSEN